MKRFRRLILLSLPLALVLGAVLGASWVLHSESGSRWLFTRLATVLPGELSVQQIAGDLGGGLRLSGLHYRDEEILIVAETLQLSVNLDVLPPAFRLETLYVQRVDIQSLDQGRSEASGTDRPRSLALPVAVTLADARFERVRMLDPAGEILLELDSLTARARAHRTLNLDELVAISAGHVLELSGILDLAPPHRLSIEAVTSGKTALRLGIAGELEDLRVELSSRQPDLELRGTVSGLLTNPHWDLTAESPAMAWPPGGDDPDWTLSSLVARTSGRPNDYRLQLDGEAAAADFPAVRVQFAGAGNLESLDIERLDLVGPDLELSASGKARWIPEPAIELETRLERFNPHSWVADWPHNLPLHGRASLSWRETRIRLSSLELTQPGSAALLRGEGTVDLEAAVVDGRLAWTGLSWPPGSTTPGLRSDTGDLTLAGSPDDWQLSGRLSIAGADLPPGDLRLSGHGDRRSAQFVLHDAGFLGGRIAGHGAFEWDGVMPFSATLQLESIETGALLADFPAKLTGGLDLSGQVSPLLLNAEIKSLRGTLRQIPVSVQGGISWSAGRAGFQARQLELRSGAAFLILEGDPLAREGLGFELDVDSLSRFVSNTSGALRGHGRISLYADQPTLAATFEGSRLTAAGLEVDQLSLKPEPEGGSELTLTGLQLGGQALESLSLRMPGRTPLQRMEISASYGTTRLDSALSGGLSDWSDLRAATWRGSLEQLRIDHEGQFELMLEEAAPLRLGVGQFELTGACLSGSRETRLCLDGHWRDGQDAALAAQLVAVPLGLLESFLDEEVELTQILNGQLAWSRASGGRGNGSAAIDIAPGFVLLADDPEPILRTGPGHIGCQLVDGSLRQGRLSLQLPGSGELEVDFNVPDVANGADSPVQGRVHVAIGDLAFVNRLQHLFDEVRGELDVDLSLAGTLAKPVFEGSASMRSAHLENRASGLKFSEVNLAGRITSDSSSQLSGRFRAGDGVGQLNLDVRFREMISPELRLGLRGETLTIVDVPELRVVADPDITLSWQDRMLEIGGRLTIPSARLAPVYLPEASIVESQDVLIVAGQLPQQVPEQRNEKPVRLRGELEVELGKDVVVDLDLARANVTGLTVFRWHDALVPSASGNFDLSGEILAYGQQLNITQGRIGFPDIPADNPHLNIRAEREIFGNTQIRRAGLMVAGTARQPVIEAYTVPATDRDRAQTLLVTGSDFNYEQGVGAVGVGTYVLPRLYVSYGIGIFEDGNTISARYDLGRGFGVKATSGERETGVDLNYRIEH